jgi:hypothetical protein
MPQRRETSLYDTHLAILSKSYASVRAEIHSEHSALVRSTLVGERCGILISSLEMVSNENILKETK